MAHSSTLRLVTKTPAQQIAADAVAQYHKHAQLTAERDAIADLATLNGHFLGDWRCEGTSRTALTQCWLCAEGARLDLELGTAHLTAGLTQPCRALPPYPTCMTGEVI